MKKIPFRREIEIILIVFFASLFIIFYLEKLYYYFLFALIMLCLILSLEPARNKTLYKKLGFRYEEISPSVLLSIAIVFTSLFFNVAFQIFSASSNNKSLGLSFMDSSYSIRAASLLLILQTENPFMPASEKAQLNSTSYAMIANADSSKSLSDTLLRYSDALNISANSLLMFSVFSVTGVLARILNMIGNRFPNKFVLELLTEYANVNLFFTITMFLYSLGFLFILFR